MDKIIVKVKGSRREAEEAMRARGVSAPVLLSEMSHWTSWAVPPGQRAAVVSWFREPAVCEDGVGFPAGTLLHHS
jgi:hypothetical protein